MPMSPKAWSTRMLRQENSISYHRDLRSFINSAISECMQYVGFCTLLIISNSGMQNKK